MKRKDFAQFYDRHMSRIYKFVYFRAGGSREVAEDLTQDIFVKALNAFDSYDPKISESAWIYTIARNHIINYQQKQKPQVDIDDVEGHASMKKDWNDVFECKFDADRLLSAIYTLPEEEATIVQMKYLEGWKYEEIGQVLGRSPGALRVQATRILKKLRNVLKQK